VTREPGAHTALDVDVDVAIVGGGPAGAAAALTLLHHTSRSVAVIERTAFETPRIGESTSSSILSLLRFVGASHVLSDDSAQASCAAAAAWGAPEPMVRHALFTSHGDGLLLDRRAFDARLCDEVAARGGQVLRRHDLQRVTRSGEHLVLGLAGADRPVAVRCRFAIDASGRSARLARQLGAVVQRDDTLVGVALRLARPAGTGDDQPEPPATLVEATPDGWWYTAPVPDGQLVAVLMTDAALVRALRLTEPDGIRRALDPAPYTRARLVGRSTELPRIMSAASQRLAEPAGPGWVAAGDAVAAFDPLSSMGIGHALWSGIHAARLAEDVLLGPSSFAADYARAMQAHHDAYLELRRRFYRIEQRWPDRPFWRSRHQASAATRGRRRSSLAGETTPGAWSPPRA
jgi:flavin-dependent dehydrogenase